MALGVAHGESGLLRRVRLEPIDEKPDRRMSICAGTLDAPTGIREKNHIFVASKGDYYEIAGDLPKYDTLK
jgi:hypothetical protein